MTDTNMEETPADEGDEIEDSSQGLSDQEILDRPYVEFEIDGKSYKWYSLARKQQRRFRDRMYATSAKCGELVHGKTKDEISKAPLPLFIITDILEILEDFHVGIADDMESIDKYVCPTRPQSTKEIATAFGLLFAKWIAPNMTITDDDGNVADGSGVPIKKNR